MLTLIKREIQDILLYLILPYLALAILIISLAWHTASHYSYNLGSSSSPFYAISNTMAEAIWLPLIILPLISAGFGSYQMCSDRIRKISTFLSTLATTRNRILAARIITGVSFILTILLPLAATYVLLYIIYPRIVPGASTFFVPRFVIILLASVAAYSIGMLLGQGSKMFIAFSGSILLLAVLAAIIIIKGFGLQSCVILVLIAVAAFIRTWQKFVTTAI